MTQVLDIERNVGDAITLPFNNGEGTYALTYVPAHGDPVRIRKLDDGCFVVGYITHDDGCENPLTYYDGNGSIYTCRKDCREQWPR